MALAVGRDIRASWSVSFLPGSVRLTLANNKLDRIARFAASMTWISALKTAYTERLNESRLLYDMITEPGL